MFKNKTKASEATQILLIEQLTCWKNKNISNENQAFSYFYQKSEYFLKMLWQGRFNKLSDKDKELNLWISENYLPKEYNLDTKNIDKLSLQLLNLEINQDELVQQV